jgi:hypothetical protein
MKKSLPTLVLLLLSAGVYAQFLVPAEVAIKNFPAGNLDTFVQQKTFTVGPYPTFSKPHAAEMGTTYSRPGRTILSHTIWGGLTGFSLGVSLTHSDDPYFRPQLQEVLTTAAFGAAIGITAGALVGTIKALEQKRGAD